MSEGIRRTKKIVQKRVVKKKKKLNTYISDNFDNILADFLY